MRFFYYFSKNSSRQKLGGKCLYPQMTSLQDCGGLLQCLQGHAWPLRFAACFNKTSGETSMLVACFSSIFLFSFSALRRLKTWLRSTMTQRRLNRVMIYYVHS